MFGFEKYAASLEEAQELSKTEYFWYIYGDNDYSTFDFDFVPPSWEWNHKFIWPSKWQEDGRTVLACKWDLGPDHYMYDQQVGAQAKLDVFVVDTFNKANDASYDSIRTQGRTVRLRSTPNVVDTIIRCCKKAETDFIWVVSTDYDYSNFDFSWHPNPWQLNFVHVFGSKWQKWSNVFYINVNEFMRLSQWYDDIKNFPELNFVENQSVTLFNDNREIWWIDHSNPNAELEQDHKAVRFFDSYLETIKRIVTRTDQEYVWVTSSVCSYKDFDFGWEPEPWQQDMLHVFPSNEQAFGDTFYVPVEKFRQQMDTLELLDWFDTVNYVKDQTVYRYLPTTYFYKGSLTDAVKQTTFHEPYIKFRHQSIEGETELFTPSLWRKQDRAVHAFNDGGVCLVPKDAKTAIKRQIYDYDYILRYKSDKIVEKPQDIVFISYDEENMESNWEVLKQRFPRAKRVHKVEGMVNALKEAARVSDTEYYYAVFAKTQLHEDFDFDYQPDSLKVPSHYLFHGRNMSNGLEYGTLGVTMYNCDLVLNAETWGVDFTTSFPVHVVPQLSAYGYFAATPYQAWRTAFRECTKLRSKCIRDQVDIETEYRLDVWTSKAEGDYAEWVLAGANDGVAYADTIETDDQLMIINDWNWLRQYYNSRYPEMSQEK